MLWIMKMVCIANPEALNHLLFLSSGITKDSESLSTDDIHLKLTQGKDIILTISPDDQATGGVVYTRWGKVSCRDRAELVYEGYAGGGRHNQRGNGANFLCLPKDPEYSSTTAPSWQSYLYGSEFETNNKIFSGTTQNFNVPCAVCYVPKKATQLMIPAKISCPKSWTREYYGYLMAEHHGHHRNVVYECVDKDPDRIPDSQKNTDEALFYFVEAVCNHGLPCGPYEVKKAITCAVCTK